MITNPYPTRAEVNDIFNSLEMGANSLVLAAETAVGKHPVECIILLRKMIEVFIYKIKFHLSNFMFSNFINTFGKFLKIIDTEIKKKKKIFFLLFFFSIGYYF